MPQRSSILAELLRVGAHAGLDGEHVPAQALRRRPLAEQRPGFVTRHGQGHGVGSLAAAPMEKFVIEGGVPLSGTVVPAGNKNAALPLLACALLTEERVTLHNVPRIRDTEALLELLADLGVTVERPEPNTVVAVRGERAQDATSTPTLPSGSAPRSWPPARCSRASARATMPPPGGDVIGRRRLDPHLDAFRALGATVEHGRDIVDQGARRRPDAVRLLHGRAVRDGYRERADGRRGDRRHDDHPQRRLRAARAGPRADAQQDGRGDRGHRLQRHARPRRREARRLRAHGSARTTSRSRRSWRSRA